MHELCHVRQYKKGRLSQLKYILNREDKHYDYLFDESKAFADYRIEEQAAMVEDCYLLSRVKPMRHARSPKPTHAQLDKAICFD